MKEAPSRFHDAETHTNPQAPLRHFDVDPNTGRDSFGNRIIRSQSLAYHDREGNATKAALLITPEGEAFIKSHAGILDQLDHALREIGPRIENGTYRVGRTPVELKPGYTLRYLDGGGQSEVFKLETPTGPYIIKVHVSYSQLHQPYVNEVLQMQTLAQDKKEEFSQLGVTFPRILFASGQVLCEELVPEAVDLTDDFAATNYATAVVAEDYIAEKHARKDALWNNIHVDKVHKKTVLPLGNYRRRMDGSLVWIDPVAAFSSKGPVAPEIRLSAQEIEELPHLSIEEMRIQYMKAEQAMETFIHTIEGYPEDDEASWIANAHDAFRKLGIEPHEDPNYFPADYMKAKRQILKQYGVRWLLMKPKD